MARNRVVIQATQLESSAAPGEGNGGRTLFQQECATGQPPHRTSNPAHICKGLPLRLLTCDDKVLHRTEWQAVAQRTQILYIDDIDGSQADGTVRFGVDGTAYEIDLNKKHADQLAKVIRPYVEAARRVPSSRRAASSGRASRHDQSDVRAWARAQGIKVSDRGRIPTDLMAQYQAAH